MLGFVRGVLGADAYEAYLRHHEVTACEHLALTEREFWRQKYADQDANPQGRCC